MPNYRKILAAIAAFGVLMPAAGQSSQGASDINVEASRHGEVIAVHAQLSVPVPATLAFSVLTDYDHMRQFLPGLTESRIVERSPGQLLVAQSGGVPFGPISIPFNYVRRVQLQPAARLVSHVISGSVKKADVTTTLAESKGQTLITYDSEATTVWLPFGIGASAIAAHVRSQLDSMRKEMLRRQAGGQAITQ